MKTRAGMLFALVLTLLGSTAQAAVTFSIIGTSGANPAAMSIGEQLTIDVRLSSDGTPTFGLGAAAFGYDQAIADFVSGEAVSGYLFEICIPGSGCFNGLDNINSGALSEDFNFTVPKVQFANSASLNGRIGTGQSDPGLNGVIDGGDAMFRLIFQATGPGTTEVSFGTNSAFGNVIVFQGGITEQATNDTVTITVPEPASIATHLAAISSVFIVVRLRGRRVAGAPAGF